MDFIQNTKNAIDLIKERERQGEDNNELILPVITPEIYEAYAIEEIMKAQMKKNVKLKLMDNEYIKTQPFLQKLYNDNIKRMEAKKPFYFITISPKPDTDFLDFKSSVEDCINWIFMEEGMLSYEQRGDNEETRGTGFHVHILLSKSNIEPKRLFTRLVDKFKRFCEPQNGSYTHVINVKQKKRDFIQDKIDYITGKKNDDDKPNKVNQDVIWRREQGLEEFYSFDCNTDKTVKGLRGGARPNCGVKKGTKRGPYKKKNKTSTPTTTSCENEIKVVNEKVKISF